MENLSDRELVARVVAIADSGAFAELVRRHQGLIRNWLRQLASGSCDADDLAQETFVIAWRRIHTFRGDGEFRAWLMRIAYTNFLQAKRKRKSEIELHNRLADSCEEEGADDSGRELPDLSRLLAVLNTGERACMILFYSHGYSHSEIASLCALPLGTVKSNIRRAVLRIRRKFGIRV